MRVRFSLRPLSFLCLTVSLAVSAVHAASLPKASLLFIPAPESGSQTSHVEQVMRQTKAALEAQGYRGDILLASSERTRFLRLISQRQLQSSDVEHLAQPEVAVRVCQVLSCRLGILVNVTPMDASPASEVTALTVRLTLVNPATEQWDTLDPITAQQTEFIPNPKKPKKKEIKSAHQVAGEKVAQGLVERLKKLPVANEQQRQTLAARHLARAKEHLARQQWTGALNESYQAMALVPDRSEPYALAGDVFAAQEEWDSARLQYERALLRSPEDAGLWVKLAHVYTTQSRTDLVIQMAEKGGVPDTVEANVLAGQAYIARRDVMQRAGRVQDARRDLKKAQEFYARATARAPGQLDITLTYLDLLAQSFDYDRMADALQQTIQVAPQNAVFHERLSDVLARQKKYDEAFEAMVKAWSLTMPQPLTLPEEAYLKSVHLVDLRVQRLFTEFAQIAINLDQGNITKEEAFTQMQGLREQVQAVAQALDLVKPPVALEEAHLHRQTAVSLLNQGLGAAKTYIDTGAGDYEKRVGMLLQTAREELHSAGAKSRS